MNKQSIIRATAPFRAFVSKNLRPSPKWVSEKDSKRLILFVHIPKAAGTSINTTLASIYGKNFLALPTPDHRASEGFTDPQDILALSGHYPLFRSLEFRKHHSQGKAFSEREVLAIAIVREPLQRVKSYYRFATTSSSHRLYSKTRKLSPTQFFEYLDSIDDRECWNQQSRMLRSEQTSEVNLDDFFLCSPLEEVQTFIDTLSTSLQWPRSPKIPKRNSTSSHSEQFSAELEDYITQKSERDLALYQDVKKRFNQKQFPAFENT